MHPLYNADGNAKTYVSPFVKCLRTLDPQDTGFVPKDPPYRVHRPFPKLGNLSAREVLFQGGGGISTTRPLDFIGPFPPHRKVAARPRLNDC